MPLVAVVAVIAVAAVVVAARYAPAAAASRAKDQIVSECSALQSRLSQVRQQGGDAVTAAQLEQQIDDCIRRANALGAGLDASAAQLAQADFAYQQIEAEWAHYRSTDYADSVKRNNTRNTMLRIAGDMASNYTDAINAAETAPALNRIRLSILRSIDAAIVRRNCYLTNGAGCGRLGVSEPHGNDKAADETARVIQPLTVVYAAARAKQAATRGQAGSAGADVYGIRDLASVELADCARLAEGTRAKFLELQSVPYEDIARRKNILGDLFAWERALVDCFKVALEAAKADQSAVGAGAVMRAANAALRDSIARGTCFRSGSAGCGRLSDAAYAAAAFFSGGYSTAGGMEAADNEKADEEARTATAPLAAIVRDAATAQAAIAAGRSTAATDAILRAAGGRLAPRF